MSDEWLEQLMAARGAEYAAKRAAIVTAADAAALLRAAAVGATNWHARALAEALIVAVEEPALQDRVAAIAWGDVSLRGLAGDAPDARGAAIAALGPRAAACAFELLTFADGDLPAQLALLVAIIQLAPPWGLALSLELIENGARDVFVRARAVAATVALGDAERGGALLLSVIRRADLSPAMRTEAARALALLRVEGAVTALVSAAAPPGDPSLRATCLYALATLGARETVPAIAARLSPAEEPEVILGAVTALEDLDDGASLDALRALEPQCDDALVEVVRRVRTTIESRAMRKAK